MESNDYFTFIEDTEETKSDNEEPEENTFITGLPLWDLEPPYETVKRGDSN